MKLMGKMRNYLCYCGIEKYEYNAVKKDAYVSNFEVWRILHFLMTAAFGFLFVNSLFNPMLLSNRVFYLCALIYSAATAVIFFLIKKDSITGQLMIYLSICLLFLFGALITQNKPNYPATAFYVFLLIIPMFMIDKPYFMGIVLFAASGVFTIWMYEVKPYNIWQMDLINVVIYTILGFVIHTIANSIRIKEFVLTRKINIQKDTDDLTGLKNKGALTREINEHLTDDAKNKGILFMLDVDHFKAINDTYGHDVGDGVISQIGAYLGGYFSGGETVGRFGGDEFIVFLKDTDDPDEAGRIAAEVVAGVSDKVELPDKDKKIVVSIGVAVYRGVEKNYSELFKKADVALYEVKADRTFHYKICEQ